MTRTADVVVIGGGVNGASLAYHLAARGARVTLLEKNALAAGPTGRSCGIVRQHYSHEVTARMALRALEFFENFEEIVGGPCDFHRTGFVLAARAAEIDALRTNVRMQQQVGIDTHLIDRQELAQLCPGFDLDGIEAAAWEPRAGYADAHATTLSLARAAARLGAEVATGVAAHDLRIEHGRVRGVCTNDGTVACEAVVLATGPWTAAFARRLGLSLPIFPSRVQVCVFDVPEGFRPPVVFIDSPQGIYCRPETGPMLLVGSIAARDGEGPRQDPDAYHEGVDAACVERYGERIMRRVPAMAEGRYHGGYASLYDVTPDWQPIVGALPVAEGLFCLAGCSGHGFKLAPVMGERLAARVLEGADAAPELGLFSPGRFARAELAPGRYKHPILG